jgi:hypothetical protein
MAQVACTICPEASIAQAEPPDNTVDARQPYAPDAPTLRQGIGSSAEPIVIALDPPVAGAEACFDLCETRPDPVDGDNMISTVTYLGNGEYEIVLDHPITVGAVTTIEYKADRSLVTYTSHPANADGNTTADGGDVVSVIDCCLEGTCQTAPGAHSCDIDHSGRPGPADMLRTIDLLNGATPYDPWSDTQRPVNLSCPIR